MNFSCKAMQFSLIITADNLKGDKQGKKGSADTGLNCHSMKIHLKHNKMLLHLISVQT